MSRHRNIVAPCIGTALAFSLLFLLTVSLAAQDLSSVSENGLTIISHGGKTLLEYRNESHPTKLYVSRWFTPGGVQVLRDSPHDHVHHHALMYAIGIDDVDFWSEVPPEKFGRQVSVNFGMSTTGKGNGTGEAEMRQAVRWIGPDGQVLAEESRNIRAHIGAVSGASLLTWQFKLRPAEGNKSIKLWGRHYFGLGMRFVESMDKGSEFVFPGDQEGITVRGTEKLTRAPWCAVYGQADGKPVTIAMFDAPENSRHPATWFTMTSGFAYLAATLNLDKEPLTVPAAKPLMMRYGVAAWDGKVTREEIEKAYRQWLKLKPRS